MLSGVSVQRGISLDRLRFIGAVLVLALPLSLGWHPVPTMGSLAEAVAVFCTAVLLASTPMSNPIDQRRLWLGTGGVLGLLLFRCLMQPVVDDSAYTGFWLGPFVVLVTGFIVCCYATQSSMQELRVVAAAVLLAALINASIGFLQYWRVTGILDHWVPYLAYWDRADTVAHGNVAQRNILASLCLLGIAASIYLFPKRSAPAWMLEGFLAYVVVLTASRTPLLILLAVMLLALWRDRRWFGFGNPFVRWFVVPVVVAQVLAPTVNHLLLLQFDLTLAQSPVDRLSAQGLGARPLYYLLAAEIGMQNWAWGGGWKSLSTAMVEQGYRQQLWGFDELPMHAHNILLHLWAENGLLIALLASIYPVFLVLRKGCSEPKGDFARLSLVVLIVHSWLEYPLWQPTLLFLSLVLMCTLEHRDPKLKPSLLIPQLLIRGMAVVVALGAAVTAVQFVIVAQSWNRLQERQLAGVVAPLSLLSLNPVIEPYADWLAVSMNTDSPAQRVLRLERLARWLPDAMVLGLLAEAYRAAGRTLDAQRIDARRLVVFGVQPGQ